ncbi:MAG TPA: Ig-like domain-containing protein, partial [Verrucomicrobiae bacterium]
YVCAVHFFSRPWQTGLVVVAQANLPPTVSISNPANGAAFRAPASFPISALANDSDGSVASVQFFVNGNSIGSSSGPDFSVNASGLAAGTYSLTAIATDNRGATGSAQPVSITVTNPPVVYALGLAAQPANGGTITGNAPGSYVSGSIITLTAAAAEGFAFSGWSGDATGAENPLTFTLDGPRNVVANFSPVTVPTYSLTLQVNPVEGGRIEVTPAPNGPNSTYLEGTVVSLQAFPATAAASIFRFMGWSGDATGTNNPITVIMTRNLSVTASFEESLKNIFYLTLATNPVDAGFIQVNPAPDAPNRGYFEGAVLTVTAVAVSTNVFSSWSGSVTSSIATISVTMNSDKSLTANFVPFVPEEYSLDLAVTPTNAGSILLNPTPGSNRLYATGTIVALVAQPNPGFRFANWSGSVTSTNNPLLLVMNSNQAVTAHFAALPPIDFSVADGSFAGLLFDSTETNLSAAFPTGGSISLRVSDRGSYRGVANVGGIRESFSGQFDRFGYAPFVLRRATLSGSLQLDPAGARITGFITDGMKSPTLVLYRGPATNLVVPAGNYTLMMAVTAPMSEAGLMTMQVAADGKMRMHGVLGDGTPLRLQSFVSADGRIPIYAPLYHRRGAIIGWLDLSPNGTGQGTMYWFRPPDSRNNNFPEGFAVTTSMNGIAESAQLRRRNRFSFLKNDALCSPRSFTVPAPEK